MKIVLIFLGMVFIGIPWVLGSVTIILLIESIFKGDNENENSGN